ncbi:MAG: Flp pilus assembly complex ATPase component TadA, partial [Acidimicrobiia bacterium]|nr:Flp pilus assembly complex ATPase component TadA [Acidimicrobiia bacterium]
APLPSELLAPPPSPAASSLLPSSLLPPPPPASAAEAVGPPIHWVAPGAMPNIAMLRVEQVGARPPKTATAGPEDAEAPEPEALPATSLPPADPSRLGEMLIARGRITREQLDLALAEQIASGLRLGSQLVALGFLDERQLIETLADQLGLPMVDLRLTAPDPEAIAAFPEALARRYEVVPLRKTAAGLELAVAEALNGNRAALEEGAGGPVVVVLAPPSEIMYAIDQAYVALDGVEQPVKAFEVFASTRPQVETGTELVVDEPAPVVQVVTLLLTQAMRDRASVIHIEPQDDSVRVRFRIDGVLRNVTTVPQSMAQALISRIKVMADMNIVERRRPQDGQIATTIDDRPVDIRVATTATIWGEKAVLRVLDKTRSLRSLKDLGMTPETSKAFQELVTSPYGMVLCVGPTGSGKTTTLYAALTEINGPERNITTIEDPVEYVLPSINQIQVNPQAGITFADGLKSILRQDPDVILVGEIRDVETASIAVQSALTGHFVLSSLHATDAATALQRFRDMGIEPFLLTSSVLAVEAQRLVRRICVHCKQPYTPTPPSSRSTSSTRGRPAPARRRSRAPGAGTTCRRFAGARAEPPANARPLGRVLGKPA